MEYALRAEPILWRYSTSASDLSPVGRSNGRLPGRTVDRPPALAQTRPRPQGAHTEQKKDGADLPRLRPAYMLETLKTA